MKKKIAALIALLAIAVTGCQKTITAKTVDFSSLDSNTLTPTTITGELGEFELDSPFNNAVVDDVPSIFTWGTSANAETYTLEICSSQTFANDVDTIDYYSQRNLTTNHFSIGANLTHKNATYYWRVFAVNSSGKKQSTSTFSFFLKAPEVEEVKFDLGEADDWSLHAAGSYADISIDNSNFFGNNEESLVVSFKQEDTNQGIASSDGWIIVTRTIEKAIYGTDALFFNMYYSGHDANIFIRVVDRDNEFWHKEVQVSNNAKQTVILKFDDFTQRTKDVTVNNFTFDYERIKYLEVVFERSFGDGVFLMSGLKAIKFDNYRNLFIEQLDFSSFSENEWQDDTYAFEKEINGAELTLKHYGTTEDGHQRISSGYGFAKLVATRYLYGGDAIKVSVKYTGNKGTNVLLRVYEEDTDRWSYKIPYSLLSDEYKEIVIPFKAFAASYYGGDGKRQFYCILNLQFGCEGQYGTGTLSFKDFEIVKTKDFATETQRIVGPSGVVETFDNYTVSSELYFIWQTSTINKDEYMLLNSTNKVGGSTNKYCATFEYKSDMAPAEYGLPLKLTENFSAVSLWLKDNSAKSGDTRLSHVTNYSPDTILTIYLSGGEKYTYVIHGLDRTWNNYVIPFSEFTISNLADLGNPPSPISSDLIAGFSISFQYFYYAYDGKPFPVYTISNQVYVDNIAFTHDTVQSKTLLERIIALDGNVATIDDFEYNSNDELLYFWNYGREYDYNLVELSNEVNSEGGNHSMKMQYKTKKESPAYFIAPTVDEGAQCTGIRLMLKGDDHATIYINVYLTVGSSDLQFRYTIYSASSQWTEYMIGFSNFELISGPSGNTLKKTNLYQTSKISIGMTYNNASSEELSYVYVDNMRFDKTISYSTEDTRVVS